MGSAFNHFGHHNPPVDMQFLPMLLAEEMPSVGIEVGCFVGQVTSLLAQYCKSVLAVDTFQGTVASGEYASPVDVLRTFCENLGELVPEIVHPLVGQSHIWASVLKPVEAGIVVIDGCHDFHRACQDMKVWWPHLKEGGLMVVHDFYVFNTVNKALRWAFGEGYANVAQRDVQSARIPLGGGKYLPTTWAMIRK